MKRIVLVEDERDLNSLIKAYLEKAGYEVISYLNGEDAIENTSIDAHLWILDIMLGGDISGYDILKKIWTYCEKNKLELNRELLKQKELLNTAT